MLHHVAGRKLGRNTGQRKALFRALTNQLILNEKITTTEAKAKAVRPLVEKLVTRAKDSSLHSRRLLQKALVSENSVKKMIELIGPKFKDRPGGYTRIVKVGTRSGDKASLVSLMFVEAPSAVVVPKKIEGKVKKLVSAKVDEKGVEKKKAKKVRITKAKKEKDAKSES
ncbi:MAG TPA: 50S ribosomal protein L17 [Candidatus Nanoarchaeia archaeon]|nr:50S ribosomal protein L17 [uncultured archaeon]